MHRRIRLLAFLILLPVAFPLAAADTPPSFIGPLRIRDLSPISVLRLDFVPPHACETGSLSVFRVNYSEANIFILSDTARSYLRSRGSSGPLTGEDIERLEGSSEDYFLFDAELAFTDFEYIRAITPSTQVRVEWPLLSRGGGFLDRFIESFHDYAGLNSADRDVISRNSVNISARMRGRSFTLLEEGTRTAWGDPTVSLSRSFPLPRGARLVAEGAVKIAIADSGDYFSSGASDLGVQLSVEKEFRRNAFYGSVNYVDVGKDAVLGAYRVNDSRGATVAWERKAGAKTWTIAQASWSRGTLAPRTDSPLDDDRTQVSLGLRRMISPHVVATVAMTENIVQFKNTPDFGMHVALAWINKRTN